MARIRDSRPSPAIIVAILALIVAVGGTALAGQDERATPGKISKKKVKKIANRQIDRRLPLGAEDIADGSLGTAELSSSIPAARVTRTTAQSIPFQSNDAAVLTFDSEGYDTAAMHDDAINNSRLTAPVTGIYTVTAQISWSASAVGSFRILSLKRNGGLAIARGSEPPVSSGLLPMEVSTEVRLEAGDYVEATVFHDVGSGLSITKSPDFSPEFSMTWLAPGP